MSLDKAIRTTGEPSYGVTLHYDATHSKVTARSHVPYVWVNTDQMHVDKSTYRDASPIEHEFVEYSTAMMCTINSIETEITTLTARRDALQNHLNASMMLGRVSDEAV